MIQEFWVSIRISYFRNHIPTSIFPSSPIPLSLFPSHKAFIVDLAAELSQDSPRGCDRWVEVRGSAGLDQGAC